MVKSESNIICFYGSQTGTAEDFANRLSREAVRYGLKGKVVDPEDWDMEYFLKITITGNCLVIFCLATYGDGDPTDNAWEFYQWLKNVIDVKLTNVCYTVFGLGNKTYKNFNDVGKYVDKRLEELGGTRIHQLGLGDDNSNIDDHFLIWKEKMWMSACKHFRISGDKSDLNTRQYRLEIVNLPADKIYKGEVVRLGAFDKQRPPYDSKNPFLAKVIATRELNTGGNRSCLHMEFDITKSQIKYDCGDHLIVLPCNDPLQVESLAQLLNVDLNQTFSMVAFDNDNYKRHPFPCPTTFRTALTYYTEINNPPKSNVLGELSVYTSDLKDANFLKELAEGKDKYKEWIENSQRNIIDVLEEIPSLKVPIDHLLEILPRLRGRYYSLSSSPKKYPNTIHITAMVVEYLSKTGREKKGVATNYLQRIHESLSHDVLVPIYVKKNQFKLPYKSKTPIIMVGPGTGLAPFRGFIQDRAVEKNAGKEIGETILYFGCRSQAEDFLYENELKEAVCDGVITDLYVAFSRDQEKKVYVQHLMKQETNRKQIWDIVKNGGHFYVCGEAMYVVTDLDNTLLEILESEGGMTSDEARNYFSTMQSEGRYFNYRYWNYHK